MTGLLKFFDYKPNRTTKTIFLILLMIFLNALIQGYFINQINFISPQDTGLLNIAREIVSKDTFTEAEKELMEPYKNHPPLYSIICGVIYLFAGNIDIAPKIYYIIFSSAIIIPVFLISLRLYGMETAIISTLLLIFLPALSTTIYYSMRHVIFIFLLYSSLYFVIIAYLDGKAKYYGYGGFLLGLTYLARGEGLIIFLSLLFIIILISLFEEKKINITISKKGIIFACCFMLVFIPHLLYLHNLTGNWSLGGDKKYQYVAFISGQGVADKIKGDSDDLSEYGYKIYGSGEENNYSILNAIKKKPIAYLSRIVKNVRNLLDVLPSPTVLPFYLYPFIGFALIESLRNVELMKVSIIFMAAIISLIILLIMIFHVQPRLITPIVPIMAIWSAYGIKKTQDILKEMNYKNLIYFPSIIIVLSLSVMFFAYTKTIADVIPRETKIIGEWVKSNTSLSDLVVVPKEWYDEKYYLQYYSKRKVRNDSSISGESILILKEDQINLLNKKLILTELNTFKIKDKKIVVYKALL